MRLPSTRPAIGTIDAASRRSRTSRSSDVVHRFVLEEVDDLDRRRRGTWPASRSALTGSASQRATRSPTLAERTRSATASPVRKLDWMNSPSVSPNCSLRSVMIAVWGIGTPSGWRNSATTANQSASPPTSDASAVACT